MEWLQKIDLRFGRIGRKKFFVLNIPLVIIVVMTLFLNDNILKAQIVQLGYYLTIFTFWGSVIFSYYISVLRLHDVGLNSMASILIMLSPFVIGYFNESLSASLSKGISFVPFAIRSGVQGDRYGETDNNVRKLLSANGRIGKLWFWLCLLWCIGAEYLITGCYNINIANGNTFFAVLMIVFMILNVLLWCNVYSHRIHDIGKNGRGFCCAFSVLYIARKILPQLWPAFWGYVILSILYLLFVKSDNEENEYGMPPTTIPWMKK
ncbi:MAG: DUF805 domain-containing protein [Acidaminococcaceae bacterium]|nr:DUF805 domain-containing protein [Acidaminococcaceae bacterium]